MTAIKFRIATYNIHKGVSPLRSVPRVHALKQAISSMEADILFLQEVQGRHDRFATKHATNWPEMQHQFLAGDSHHCAYGLNAMYDHGHHGNALLSRFPIESARNQDVSDHAFERRGILHCQVKALHADIHCYVIHLGLFAGSRKRQAEALVEAVQSSAPPEAPIIIAGDFNDWGNHLGDLLRNRLGVEEVFEDQMPHRGDTVSYQRPGGVASRLKPARTFPSVLPWLRLDRIYLRGFSVESAQVLRGSSWATLSDHAPIVATVHLKEGA